MSFTLAVSPSVRSPGFYLVVNLLAGITSGAGGARRCLLLGVISSAGDLTADTEIRQSVAGADAVSTAFGPGSPAHLAAKALFKEYPLARVDVAGCAPPAGVAASGTFTFTTGGTVTVAVVFDFYVCGRWKEISWNPGESVTVVAAKVATYYTSIQNDLPCTVTSSLGVVTVAAKEEGTDGNDYTIAVFRRAGGLPVDAVCAASGATLSGGTLVGDISTALSTAAGTEYDYIACVVGGNADTGTASATSCPGRVKTHVNTYNTGASAKLQQSVFGATGSLSTAKTGAAQQNEPTMQFVIMRSGQSIPAEICGAEVGRRMRQESEDPTVNANGTLYKATLYGPLNMTTGPLSDTEREDAYQSGVTPIVFTSSGEPMVDRPITTHWKDSNANADDRALDVSVPTGTYAFAKRLRVSLPQQFPGSKLSADLVEGDNPLPPNTVEVREIKAFVESEAKAFADLGYFDRTFIDAAIANGEFIARINPLDRHQCDLIIPTRTAAGYLKTSAVVNAQ